jgi:hypothetical protein
VRMWELAESVGRYRPKEFSSLVLSSSGSTNDRYVLIRTQLSLYQGVVGLAEGSRCPRWLHPGRRWQKTVELYP